MTDSKQMSSNYQLFAIAIIAFFTLGVGAVFYHFVEKLSWLDAFYFATITLTTIGYGDISPKTDLGKLFTIPYAIMGIGILGAIINALSQRRVEKMKDRQQQRLQVD